MKTTFCGWLVKAFKKETDSPKHQQFVVCAKVMSGKQQVVIDFLVI
jgi:hypothetical protein